MPAPAVHEETNVSENTPVQAAGQRLFDVHLIEKVRIKIAQVPASSPQEALEKASRAPLGEIIDREFEIPLDGSVCQGAYAQALAFCEDAPVCAMVEEAGNTEDREVDERHFDYDDVAGRYIEVDLSQHDSVSPEVAR